MVVNEWSAGDVPPRGMDVLGIVDVQCLRFRLIRCMSLDIKYRNIRYGNCKSKN